MKTILASLFLLIGLSSFGQVAIRSLGGSGTNLSLWGTGLSYPLVINNGNGIRVNDAGGNHVVQIDATGFTGNGAGLTNLAGATNFPSSSTYVFNGKVTFNSNIVMNALNFVTNQAAVTTLNLGNNYQYVSTNNNIAYTGFTGILAGETNAQWCTVIVTNTSGSLKTVTLTGVIGDATVYVTNQSVFTVMRYPLAGTNVVGRSLN